QDVGDQMSLCPITPPPVLKPSLLDMVPGIIHGVSPDRPLDGNYSRPFALLEDAASADTQVFNYGQWISGAAEAWRTDSVLTRAYDVTGNDRHWSQTNKANCPVMVTSGQFERYFDGKAIGAN